MAASFRPPRARASRPFPSRQAHTASTPAGLVDVYKRQLQEAGGGAHHAHVGGHRLHDHRRHLAGVLLQQGLHAGQIVELGGEGVPGRPHRHAGAAGVAPRQGGGAGVDQHTVGVAAVSYTHLDVYKRQPKDCDYFTIGAGGRITDVLVHPPIAQGCESLEVYILSKQLLLSLCLLYTSRCV